MRHWWIVTSLIHLLNLSGCGRPGDVVRWGYMCRSRSFLPCAELHLNLQLLCLLSRHRLNHCVVVAPFGKIRWHSLDAGSGARDSWVLLMRATVNISRQSLMMSNRLYLALRDLLNLLGTLT